MERTSSKDENANKVKRRLFTNRCAVIVAIVNSLFAIGGVVGNAAVIALAGLVGVMFAVCTMLMNRSLHFGQPLHRSIQKRRLIGLTVVTLVLLLIGSLWLSAVLETEPATKVVALVGGIAALVSAFLFLVQLSTYRRAV